MRFKPEAPSPDRSYVNFLAKSELLAKSESAHTVDDLCRQRNLANATSMHSSVAIQPCQAAIHPIDGGLVGCAARHLQLQRPLLPCARQEQHPIAPSSGSLAHGQALGCAAADAVEPSQLKSYQNHDVAAATRDMPIGNVADQRHCARSRSAIAALVACVTLKQPSRLRRSGRHECA
jgi:hypothetical protein